MSQAHEKISKAISDANAAGRTAVVPFLTAGYPDKNRFIETLKAIASVGDVVEVGVPFSDPMADGVTIQRSSHAAIEAGVSLRWILEELCAAGDVGAPLVLMSYLNPLLAYGYEALAADALAAGVCGFIVPDLPLDEAGSFGALMAEQGMGLVQLVTPVTPPARRQRLLAASRGFTYAVTVTGITGGDLGPQDGLFQSLATLRAEATTPVMAGFGIRHPSQVAELAPHVDGVIVGSALLDCIRAGRDPVAFLSSLSSANREVFS